MRTQLLLTALAVFASLPVANTGIASANEYSCANAAAANGYVNENKFLWQVGNRTALSHTGSLIQAGISTQAEAVAAVAAAEQYLRSLGYDAATVEQMDIAGHGV